MCQIKLSLGLLNQNNTVQQFAAYIGNTSKVQYGIWNIYVYIDA